MHAYVASAVDGFARLTRLGGKADERECEALLSLRKKLIDAPLVDEVLQAGLLAVRAVAVFVEDTNHSSRNRYCLVGSQ